MRPIPTHTLALTLALTATALADWNTGVGGNATRDGLAEVVGPAGPDVLWTGSLPAIVAQQAVIDGDLVVVSRIGSFTIPTGTWIVAHELATGDIRWQTQLPESFPGKSWRSRVTAIRDGQVYATRAGNTNAEYLYALDPADGSIIWRSDDLIDESSTESLSFAPNGDLIAGNFSSVMRIDRTDGSTVWTASRGCPTTDGCAAAVFGDRVYVWEPSPFGPIVSAFDLGSGAELYSSEPRGGGFIEQLGLLVGPDGTIYAPRTQNNPVTDFFVAFTDTGAGFEEKWRVPMGYTPFASFAVGPDGSVYSYSRDQEVIRIDPDEGTILDTSIPIAGDFFSPRIAIDAEGKVFVTNGSFDGGSLFAFDADLTLRWQKLIDNVNLGGPALGDGGVMVVCGVGGNVIAYQTPATCPADLDGSGDVGFTDLIRVLADWGPCPPPCPPDLDASGDVGFTDLLAVLAAWGPCR
ncbi:MAG: PQQ-binding-like beta-propeller repeat protein [Phycisphaerales bacterium]|nr:PQQ-binding-like beta-propeller repeat protein [Phycisphaerales bacterium]